MLQYFDDQNARKERGSWRIDPTSSMAKYTERVNAFTVLVGGKPIILAADDELALEKWEKALAVPMGKVRLHSEEEEEEEESRHDDDRHNFTPSFA